MGKTQNTGRLTNGIFQDSSNNIAIGDSTASGYKFKVTGTSNLNGALNGTSATFSGALSGTSATFSGQVNSSVSRINGRLFTTSDASYGDMLSTTGVLAMSYDAAGQTGYITSRNYTTSTNTPLVFTSSAATFSSSVTATSLTLSSASTPLLQIVDTTNSKSLLFGADDNNTFIRSSSSTPIFLQVNGGDTAMTLTSSGNVGIGTSSPDRKLQVYSGGAGVEAARFTDGARADLIIGFPSAGVAMITAEYGGGGDLAFGSGTSRSERMRITSGGNVGIGTSSPVGDGTALNIYGTTYATLKMQNSTTGTAITDGSEIVVDGSNWIFKNREAGDNIFYTANTERMRITSGGNVIVGGGADISVADSNLAISNNSITASRALVFYSANSYNPRAWIKHVTTTGSQALVFDSTYGSGTGSANFNFLGGNVGIGVSNPYSRLQVDGVANANTAYFNASTTTSQSYGIYMKAGTNANDYAFSIVKASDSSATFQVRGDGVIVAPVTYNIDITSGRTLVVRNDGVFGYIPSTIKAKTNVASIENVDWVYDLNPVNFNYRKKNNENKYTDEYYEQKEYGLIAEEVAQVNQDFVFYDTKEDGSIDLKGVHYDKLIPVLVKAIQELSNELTELKALIAAK